MVPGGDRVSAAIGQETVGITRGTAFIQAGGNYRWLAAARADTVAGPATPSTVPTDPATEPPGRQGSIVLTGMAKPSQAGR